MAFQTFLNLPLEKQKRIISCAIDEFVAWPYDKTNINRIIENAGIAKGSFYQYFENKDDLYAYCITDVYRKLFDLRQSTGDTTFLNMLIHNSTHSSTENREDLLSLLGERDFKFLQSIMGVPKQVRNNVILSVTETLSIPFIHQQLQNDSRIKANIDLDFYAYLISMSEFLVMEYGILKNLSSDQMKLYSAEYMSAIFATIIQK